MEQTNENQIVNSIQKRIEIDEREGYKIGQQYEGYLLFNEDGTINFKKKEKRYYRNGFQTIRTDSEFTIQKSEKYIKVTLTLERAKLSFNGFLRTLTRLSNAMDILKLIPLK